MIDLRTPDSKLGVRSLTLESPEPADDAVVRADFPAGAYRFEGTSTKGAMLRGEARLSHAFPEPAAFEYPGSGQRGVPATDLTLRWSVPKGIESLCHRYRAKRLALRDPGAGAGVDKDLHSTQWILARRPSLHARHRYSRERWQPLLHRNRLHHGERAMTVLYPSSSYRPETNRRCLEASFRNPGRQPNWSPYLRASRWWTFRRNH